MYYVYLIQLVSVLSEVYVGCTEEVNQRHTAHNAGQSPHTAKYKPWKLVVSIAFADKQKAIDFEICLKSGSVRSFRKRHLLD